MDIDLGKFRNKYFRAFADPDIFPDEVIEVWWEVAESWVEKNCFLSTKQVEYLRYLYTAHLLYLAGIAEDGSYVNGTLSSASIDKVSVSVATNLSDSAFRNWLKQSPYGDMIAAMLSRISRGGVYVSGIPSMGRGGRF